MLTGTIRPIEARTVTVEGESLAEITTILTEQTAPGWELTAAPVAMAKGTTTMTATAVFERRDGLRDIEADDMPALEAKVPDGWLLLSVRAS